jgi:hypothetical protein
VGSAEANFRTPLDNEGAMALTILPGTRVRFDPDTITKMEICCADAARVEIRIFAAGDGEPRLFEFPDKVAAVEFYRKVWLLRSGETLDDRQIESLVDR